MKKSKNYNLAKSLQLKDVNELFIYIIGSYINGNKTQMLNLMYEFIDNSYFNRKEMQNSILYAVDFYGLKKTIFLIKQYNRLSSNYATKISDTMIINAFYDNSLNLYDVKSELIKY